MRFPRPLPFLLLLAPALALPEEPARTDGRIAFEDAQVEVLSRRLPVGRRIELPEGWFRVEEEGSEEQGVGSFSVVSSPEEAPAEQEAQAQAAPVARQAPTPLAVARTALVSAAACRAERNAYLRELWHESGIEIDDPDALIRGLDGGAAGPGTGYYWFAINTDAFRNLAWSFDLRSRAKDLQRCMVQ